MKRTAILQTSFLRFALVLLCCTTGVDPTCGQNRTETLATTGDVAPDGNGAFGFLFGVQLNNAGQVSFTSDFMTGTAGGSIDNGGVFRAGAGGLVQIDRTSNSVIGIGLSRINDLGHVAYDHAIPGGVFLDARNGIRYWNGNSVVDVATEPAGNGNEVFGLASMNGSGQIAYRELLGFVDRIHRFNPGTAATPIAVENQQVPNSTDSFSILNLNPQHRAINELGQVTFFADLSSSASTDEGIFRSDGIGLTQIARKGQVAPDGNGVLNDFRELGNAQPSINDLNEVAFTASLSGTSGGFSDSRGLFIGNGATLSQIVRSGQASPDGNGSFLAMFEPHLNNSSQVAFMGAMAENDGGVFRATAGEVIKIARTGDAAFDGDGFFSTNFAGLAHNDSGQTAFIASTANTPGGNPDGGGLFTSDGIDSVTVVRSGDFLAGSTVLGIGDNPTRGIALNRHGQIAYTAELANGRELVRLWTPELHWRSSGDGEWDIGNNWTLGLNPAEVHDVVIDPNTGVTVMGPVGDANVRSLRIGGGGSQTKLVLQGSELAVFPGSGNGILVQSDGILAGNGQINGNTEVFGTIAPGESAGQLSLQGNLALNSLSSLSIELGGTALDEFDRITVFEDLFLGGSLIVDLIDGHALGANESYLIANVGGTLTGQFIGLSEGDLVGNFGGVDLFISYNQGTGNDIALFTTVPEPNSLILLATIVFSYGYHRKRK